MLRSKIWMMLPVRKQRLSLRSCLIRSLYSEPPVKDIVAEEAEVTETLIEWDEEWEYASFSVIHSDPVTYYRSGSSERKNFVLAVNAGHGTSGGSSVRTQCHPDGSPKVTGGSTAEGSTTATAVSGGTSFLDGTSEASVTLELAVVLKELLLENGYDVLMIRESDDAQIDNVARTVYANNNADCHIALHYDSTETDKGFFYIGVPDIAEYKSMEPVASHWQEHDVLGQALVAGEEQVGVGIYGNGFMGVDLTQISYSTIPSVDVEVGDRASDYSQESLDKLAEGMLNGLNIYTEQQ